MGLVLIWHDLARILLWPIGSRSCTWGASSNTDLLRRSSRHPREPEIVLDGAMPSPTAEIGGCPFASRCPRKLGAICDNTPPRERTFGPHRIACHIAF
jgi:ABC-type dipeptide/oligopeptide/nickel transport system ATPase component